MRSQSTRTPGLSKSLRNEAFVKPVSHHLPRNCYLDRRESNDQSHPPAVDPLAYDPATFRSIWDTRWDLLMAAATVMILPIIILFFIGQRYFIQGVVLSGLKG